MWCVSCSKQFSDTPKLPKTGLLWLLSCRVGNEGSWEVNAQARTLCPTWDCIPFPRSLLSALDDCSVGHDSLSHCVHLEQQEWWALRSNFCFWRGQFFYFIRSEEAHFFNLDEDGQAANTAWEPRHPLLSLAPNFIPQLFQWSWSLLLKCLSDFPPKNCYLPEKLCPGFFLFSSLCLSPFLPECLLLSCSLGEALHTQGLLWTSCGGGPQALNHTVILQCTDPQHPNYCPHFTQLMRGGPFVTHSMLMFYYPEPFLAPLVESFFSNSSLHQSLSIHGYKWSKDQLIYKFLKHILKIFMMYFWLKMKTPIWSELIFIVFYTLHTIAQDSSKKISHPLPYENSRMDFEVPKRDFVRKRNVFLYIYSKAFPMLWELKIIFYIDANFKLSPIVFIFLGSVLLLWAQYWFLV